MNLKDQTELAVSSEIKSRLRVARHFFNRLSGSSSSSFRVSVSKECQNTMYKLLISRPDANDSQERFRKKQYSRYVDIVWIDSDLCLAMKTVTTVRTWLLQSEPPRRSVQGEPSVPELCSSSLEGYALLWIRWPPSPRPWCSRGQLTWRSKMLCAICQTVFIRLGRLLPYIYILFSLAFRKVLLSKQRGTEILNWKRLQSEACVCHRFFVVDSLLSLEDISDVER